MTNVLLPFAYYVKNLNYVELIVLHQLPNYMVRCILYAPLFITHFSRFSSGECLSPGD